MNNWVHLQPKKQRGLQKFGVSRGIKGFAFPEPPVCCSFSQDSPAATLSFNPNTSFIPSPSQPS